MGISPIDDDGMSEAYYSCPHCRGKIRIVLETNGLLKILKREAQVNEGKSQ